MEKRNIGVKPALVILAAGMGSRFGGIKQMAPVGPSGEILMDYSIFDALRAGFGKVVFVIRHDFEEAFRRDVGSRYEGRIDIAYAFQALDALPAGYSVPGDRTKPWGTAHATLVARDAVGGLPFAVINADDFYGRDTFARLGGFLASDPAPGDYAMAGFRLRATLSENGTVARGICDVAPDGFLRGILEMTRLAPSADGSGAENREDPAAPVRLTGDETVSMNAWGFPAAFLDRLEERFPAWLDAHAGDAKAEWYLPGVVDALVAGGLARVRVLPTDSPWFGVTYREDRPRVAAALARLAREGVYPTPV